MCKSKAARQKGVTLIEILLVAVIVAASIVGVFMFSKNARLTAAVSAEQAQVEQTVKTLQGIFANQPNYGSLSASYLNDKASGSGLMFREDASGIVLDSKVGEGRVVVRVQPANVSFPPTSDPVAMHPATDGNAFAISYSNLSTKECVNLTSAVAGSSVLAYAKASSDAAHRIVAVRGKVSDNKDDILAGCTTPTSAPTASLVMYFQDSRSTGAALPPSTPLAQCRPVRETQSTGCPPGQSGSIIQERVGNCTGPGNTMVYTAWTTIEDTCALDSTPPPDETPATIADDCAETTFTRSMACPGADIGQIVETRTVNSCDGTSTPWTEVSRTCSPPPATTPTCTPSSQQQTIPCPSGQGGSQVQVRSSSCPTPTSDPVWGPWSTISNNCSSSCAAAGTCCTAKRETRTVMEPCPARTYGDVSRKEERFLGCVNATTQAPNWTPWQVVDSSGTCTACPADVTETATRWVSRTEACTSGSGMVEFEAEQFRTRTISYSCPAGTTSLPAPTVGAWSPWTDTGNRRNVDSSKCKTAPACTAGSGPTVIRNSSVATDGSDAFDDTFSGHISDWDIIAAGGISCTPANDGRLVAVMQGGPIDIIKGTVFMCQGGAFRELWSQEYMGGWNKVLVTSVGASVMGIASGYHANSGVIPSPYRPRSPISNTAGLTNWDDQPGTNRGDDYFWFATWVCGSGP